MRSNYSVNSDAELRSVGRWLRWSLDGAGAATLICDVVNAAALAMPLAENPDNA